jgi:hypothetical protein
MSCCSNNRIAQAAGNALEIHAGTYEGVYDTLCCEDHPELSGRGRMSCCSNNRTAQAASTALDARNLVYRKALHCIAQLSSATPIETPPKQAPCGTGPHTNASITVLHQEQDRRKDCS